MRRRRTFTTLNATTDVASAAETPSAAASTWTSPPSVMPKHETTPAVRPCVMLRVTMYCTAGPGVTARTSAAITNNCRFLTSRTIDDLLAGVYESFHVLTKRPDFAGLCVHEIAVIAALSPRERLRQRTSRFLGDRSRLDEVFLEERDDTAVSG
jgi:hypothetical protein